jgi:hypothetical protein
VLADVRVKMLEDRMEGKSGQQGLLECENVESKRNTGSKVLVQSSRKDPKELVNVGLKDTS